MASKLKKTKILQGGWSVQWRYAWKNVLTDMLRQPLATLLTVTVITISLTLPSVCYIVWKNINQAATQWYPIPQLTLYLDQTLDDNATEKVVRLLKSIPEIEKVNYLSREEAVNEFRHWSGFGGALDMLEENPLPAVAIITPKSNFQHLEMLNTLGEKINKIVGVAEVRMDDSWFARLSALTKLIGQIVTIIGLLMVVAVFLVIGNNVRLSIFSRRDTINVMKLMGATDGFILRPFLNEGVVLGFAGALLSLILSKILVFQLGGVVMQAASVFGTNFNLQGLSWDENLLFLLVASMIGWLAAWLATIEHLRKFTPQ